MIWEFALLPLGWKSVCSLTTAREILLRIMQLQKTLISQKQMVIAMFVKEINIFITYIWEEMKLFDSFWKVVKTLYRNSVKSNFTFYDNSV